MYHALRLVLLLSVTAPFSYAQSKHAFTAKDWSTLHNAFPVAISPDAKSILYGVASGAESGPTRDEWRLIAPDGSDSRKLDLPEDFSPAGFTAAGDLYGSYDVNKHPQLAVFAIAGLNKNSTPAMIVPVPRGIHHAVISPDGKKFALLADPDPPDADAHVHTVVQPSHTSVYLVNADGTSGGWQCPALNKITEISWSPHSDSLAVLSAEPKIGFHTMREYIDVCTAAGPRRIAQIENSVTGLAWADGGAQIAFLSTTASVLTPDHVWTVPASGGAPVDRTPKLDATASALVSDAHGGVWVQIDRGVQSEIASFKNDELTTAYRWPAGVVGPPVASQLAAAPARLVMAAGDPDHTMNLAVPAGAGLKRITTVGDDDLAKIDLGGVRKVQWKSKEGIALEGIATFPAGYAEGKRYPFLVLPHGGPEANDHLEFDAFSRIIAGLGYVVLQPEYRGSTGYGSQFLDAIYQHFGDRAYRDVDSATDFAVAQGWADPNRLAIFGWSAGGFMTSWTVTQTSRYKAAVEGAGITDWAPFLWTSDIQQFDYDARWPEKDPDAFSQFSAVDHASAVITPTLILHGEADLRVPTFQGREFFEVLAANGKTTRMVTYPGSPHFPRLWEQRIDVMKEVADWLAKYNR